MIKNLKNTKGITLIALIITIIVLLILAGVTISMLTGDNGILKNAEKAAIETRAASVEEARDIWLTEVEMAKITGGYAKTMDEILEQLQTDGLLTKEEVATIKAEGNTNNEITIGSKTISFNTEYIREEEPPVVPDPPEEVLISDGSWDSEKGINTPKLTGDMEAIYWDGDSWEIPSTNVQWYNYDANLWANARTSDGSMWVWIPRYEYKIDATGVGTDYTKAGTIAVNFIETTDTTASTDYTIHPAFSTDTENGGWGTDIAGIWVAKFEMSMETNEAHTETSSTTIGNIATANTLIANNKTTNNVRAVSKPGVSSWRNINIANCYENAYYYDRTKESHLMKNSEWGAVVYLTHSEYGRDGTEVSINNNGTTYYTGGGTGTAYTSNTNQSSTGNITGIYDLSGNAYEYVAGFNKAYSGNYFTGTSYLNANGTHFASNGGSSTRYATAYSNSTSTYYGDFTNKDVSNTGDAIHEVWVSSEYGWFSDYSYFVYSSYPFFGRGGHCNFGDNAGVFDSYNYTRRCFRQRQLSCSPFAINLCF